MKLDFYPQIYEKFPNIKFHKNPSSGSRVVLCGRTEKHAANSFFFICNFANASKTKIPTSLPLGRSSSWGWLGLTGTRHALFSKVY